MKTEKFTEKQKESISIGIGIFEKILAMLKEDYYIWSAVSDFQKKHNTFKGEKISLFSSDFSFYWRKIKDDYNYKYTNDVLLFFTDIFTELDNIYNDDACLESVRCVEKIQVLEKIIYKLENIIKRGVKS